MSTKQEIDTFMYTLSLVEGFAYTYEELQEYAKKIPSSSKSTKKALDNEPNIINKFNTDKIYKNEILSMLNIIDNPNKYIAEKPKNIHQSEMWRKLKEGTKETKSTPKTDMVIRNIDTNQIWTISIKSGIGRITSADYYETKALFESVLHNKPKYNTNSDLKQNIEQLFIIMSGERYTTDKDDTFTVLKKSIKIPNTKLKVEDVDWCKKKLDEYEECNKIWKLLREKHSDYCIDLIIECLKGYLKFSDNIGAANYLLQTKSSSTTEIDKFYDLNNKDKKFQDYVNEIFNSTALTGNTFRTKSSSCKLIRNHWTRFC